MRFVDRHWGNFRLIPGTKTYDNRGNNGERAKAIIAKCKRRAGPVRLAMMRGLKLKMQTRWRMGNFLRRLRIIR